MKNIKENILNKNEYEHYLHSKNIYIYYILSLICIFIFSIFVVLLAARLS